jgi:hypothetical protein
VRKAFLVVTLAAGLTIEALPASAEVPRHIHNLTTPGTTTAIATGVSENAPCTAFLNFHENVHLGVFAEPGGNPNTVAPTLIGGEC